VRAEQHNSRQAGMGGGGKRKEETNEKWGKCLKRTINYTVFWCGKRSTPNRNDINDINDKST
jgi:hypothetical protein